MCGMGHWNLNEMAVSSGILLAIFFFLPSLLNLKGILVIGTLG